MTGKRDFSDVVATTGDQAISGSSQYTELEKIITKVYIDRKL